VESSEGITIRELTIRAGGKVLLEGTSADFPAGAVTLVLGASGAGKTVLMKVLAGLIDPGDRSYAVEGTIGISGVQVLGKGSAPGARRRAPVGIVFQSAALFDELSAEENIRFARDHRPRQSSPARPGGEPAPAQLLEELGVPKTVPVSALSGGQKQRLAIARTLAYDPPVVIYDEPTAGLDAANALRVADRIRTTGEAHGKTTVVVTHDYEHLAGIAKAIYLLDPERRKLVPLSLEELHALARQLPGSLAYQEGETATPARCIARLRAGLAGSLEATGAVLEGAATALVSLVPAWRSVRWGLRYLRHYLGLVASPSAWLYFGASGVIAGFVSTHFVFKFLPHRNYTEPLISDELLNGLGFAMYRILVPVLLTVLLAARCGAAVASDVGSRVYNHQVDAMRSMGAAPARYLLTAILYAFLLGTPFLVGLGFLAARTTSLAVFVYNHPDKGPNFWDGNFHRDLRIPGELFFRGTPWLLAKLLVVGLGVGVIAYRMGMRPKSSAVDVSRGITATIIASTLYVLLVHFVFAFLEF
jgi:ABC-type multidrug transport system ATPase subunit/ABC-type transporter Mla maintaining outer membrane lipid asymmetry permease subunit MlaE